MQYSAYRGSDNVGTAVLQIRDVYPGPECCPSWILDPIFSHPGSRVRLKEFKYFNPRNCFQALGNMIRVVHPGSGSWFFTYPGSATLVYSVATGSIRDMVLLVLFSLFGLDLIDLFYDCAQMLPRKLWPEAERPWPFSSPSWRPCTASPPGLWPFSLNPWRARGGAVKSFPLSFLSLYKN